MGTMGQIFYVNQGDGRRGRRRAVRGRAATALLAAVVALTVGVTIVLYGKSNRGAQATSPPTDARPTPAPSSPPVTVEEASGPVSDVAGGDFVLPQALHMGAAELSWFSTSVAPDTAAFASWYADHQGTAVGSGTVSVTLRGNDRDVVRVTDINVRKKCRAPFNGTFFQGYSQGTGDTVAVGFDLGSPEPFPELLARTSAGPRSAASAQYGRAAESRTRR